MADIFKVYHTVPRTQDIAQPRAVVENDISRRVQDDDCAQGNAGMPLYEREVQKELLPVEPLPYISESGKLSVCWKNLDATLEKIAQFHNLRELSLSNMNDEKMKEFAENFQMVSSLVTLDFGYGCRIGDEGAKVLADLFRENPNLRILNLYNNQIGNEGAKALADLLETNTSLSVLNLGRNQIRDAGAKAFACALEVNKGLTEIEFSHNDISAVGAQALVDALKINRTLRVLYFFYGPPAPFVITRGT
ncbi:MAG: hypothetical protein KBE16_01950 [Alphaproteobacteria bacterium]|nr:hypothetical protein [Alphaproteobacteria bacterium]MBP9878072.1 hypothetical protein [Alphaproteobacteria bacterium]